MKLCKWCDREATAYLGGGSWIPESCHSESCLALSLANPHTIRDFRRMMEARVGFVLTTEMQLRFQRDIDQNLSTWTIFDENPSCSPRS